MYPPPTQAPPSGALPRVGTGVWRLIVAGCAFFGVYTVAYHPMIGWTDLWFLSQSGSLVTAICFALLAVVALIPRAAGLAAVTWLRGALASMMLLICVASIFILGSGDLDQTGFLFEHLITPLVVAADFVFVGRDQLRTKGWHPVTWIALPLAYLILANVAGEASKLYGGILDPADSDFAMYIGMFLITAIVFGYVLFGLVKLRGAVTNGGARNTGPGHPPGGMPGPGQYPGAQAPQHQY
ncbi:hypothetical protein, partial [Stackebrandtia soli]|uniref:hypothetical protein n=1 Tax=Stackebrandtia soli TaxID=1892856 RepID=UPI0039EB70A4